MNTTPYLRDCHTRGADAELFLVEGKSAADALNVARSRRHQAVFALQGKIPNPDKASTEKILANDHLSCLFDVIGTGTGTSCDPEKSRFSKILLLCDGDIDGMHSQSLLISLCQHFLQPLIHNRLISVLKAPAYRLPRSNEADRPGLTRYLYSEAEKFGWFNECREASIPIEALTHFKGIATMGTDEIVTLLLAKATRNETDLIDFQMPERFTSPQETSN